MIKNGFSNLRSRARRAISPATAEDYVVPTGVTVITEEQLLNQIIGCTLLGGETWVEYFEPAANGLKEGRIKRLQSVVVN